MTDSPGHPIQGGRTHPRFSRKFSVQVRSFRPPHFDRSRVHDAVEDRVGQRGVVEVGVPGLDRQLAGDKGRARADAVVQQFEQVIALGRAHGREREVVDD